MSSWIHEWMSGWGAGPQAPLTLDRLRHLLCARRVTSVAEPARPSAAHRSTDIARIDLPVRKTRVEVTDADLLG